MVFGKEVIKMKRITIIMILAAILVAPLFSQAQDFSAVLQAIERVEASLKQMVETESESRTEQVTAIQRRLSKLENGENGATLNSEKVEAIEERIASVEEKSDLLALNLEKRSQTFETKVDALETLGSQLQNNPHSDKLIFLGHDLENLLTELKQVIFEQQNQKPEGLEFYGFFDLQYRHKRAEDLPRGMDYGQFEVDISMPLHDRITGEGAIAYGDGVFELGAGFLDFLLLEREEESKFVSSLGLMVGQFDVPFGIDYLSIPSPDRLLVCPPLINDKTIASWNDFGFNLYGEGLYWNFLVYGVNGFSENQAYGGRIGLKPVSGIEIGSSYSRDFNQDYNPQSRLFGVDLQVKKGPFNVKGEGFFARGLLDGENTETISEKHSGYYVQTAVELMDWLRIPAFVVGRYGWWKPDFEVDSDDIGNLEQNRITVGLGYRLVDNVEIRSQYMFQKAQKTEYKNECITTQFVISF